MSRLNRALLSGAGIYVLVFIAIINHVTPRLSDWLITPGNAVYELLFGPRFHGVAGLFWLGMMSLFNICIYSGVVFVVDLLVCWIKRDARNGNQHQADGAV